MYIEKISQSYLNRYNVSMTALRSVGKQIFYLHKWIIVMRIKWRVSFGYFKSIAVPFKFILNQGYPNV